MSGWPAGSVRPAGRSGRPGAAGASEIAALRLVRALLWAGAKEVFVNLSPQTQKAAAAIAAHRAIIKQPSAPVDAEAVTLAFARSPEYRWLAGGHGRPEWAEELLLQMASLGWSFAELDLRSLHWILFEAPPPRGCQPRNPRAIARQLHGLLVFAGRVHGAPRTDECCAYLASERAVRDIARWLR